MDLFHNLIADSHTYIGLVVGFMARYSWCVARVHWLNKHRPLPDGERREWPIISRSSIGLVMASALILFSLFSVHDSTVRTTESAAEVKQISADAKTQAEVVAACEDRLAEAIANDRRLQLENDALAAVERDLNTQGQNVTDEWLAIVVAPPQEFFDLHTTDPVYQKWARGVNAQYQAKHQEILDKQADASARRQQIVATRLANPIPDPHCAKVHK